MAEDRMKVILVDDEPLVRDLLKRCIDWNSLGLDIVGEAASACEAFGLVEQVEPEIIFTDICMPFMDGIEFSKAVLDKYPRIKIAIITGYEDFEYAQRSIKAGITDFILKPINDEEIIKVAMSIKAKIEAEKAREAEYQRLRQQLEENLPFLRERFFNELLLNKTNNDDIQYKMDYYRVQISSDAFQVGLIEVIDAARGENGEEERLLIRLQCLEATKKMFAGMDYINIFLDTGQRITILNNQRGLELAAFAEKLKLNLLNQLPAAISIGVGEWHPNYDIRSSYREAWQALQYKAIIGKNEVINFRDLEFVKTDQGSFQSEQSDQFSFYLKAGLKKEALDLAEAAFQYPTTGGRITIDQIRAVGSGIIAAVLNVISDLDIKAADLFGTGSSPYDRLFKLDSLAEIKQYIMEITGSTVELRNQLHRKKVSKVVKEVQEFLLKNFANSELSLTGVAGAFYLNPSYLSRVFKQETNQTFVEYLTQIRMEKAVNLLKSTDLKAYQVAEKVGIADPHYFGICFKKYTGLSVNDYKKCQTL